jgi:hypothetical protein
MTDIPMRKCTKCGVPKPPTTEYFRVQGSSKKNDGTVRDRTGELRRQCKTCMSNADGYREKMRNGGDKVHGRRTAMARPIIGEQPHVKGPKPCDDCNDMPWRVAGSRCARCGLAAGAEPAVEMVLRKFDRVG